METMTTSIILPFLVFFPFLGAVISYIIGRSNKGARDIWCWILPGKILIMFSAASIPRRIPSGFWMPTRGFCTVPDQTMMRPT